MQKNKKDQPHYWLKITYFLWSYIEIQGSLWTQFKKMEIFLIFFLFSGTKQEALCVSQWNNWQSPTCMRSPGQVPHPCSTSSAQGEELGTGYEIIAQFASSSHSGENECGVQFW